jgi:hypothetical protein
MLGDINRITRRISKPFGKKYTKVKKTDDGDYLGIHEEKVFNGSIFTKPKSLSKLFELWPVSEKTLPNGTPVPMLKEYIKNIDDEAPLVDSTEYRSCLGLIQQQHPVRPDIAYPISKLATRSNVANVRDRKALQHLINYLWHTRNRGLFLRGNDLIDREFRVKLIAYADAAGPSGKDSRAQYAVTFNLVQVRNGDSLERELEESSKTGKICTKSSIATTTELAMTESEIGALKECTKDVIFLRGLMEDLH